MIKILIKTFVVALALVSQISCVRNNFKEYVGPAFCPSSTFAYSSPYVVKSTGIDPTKVDFASGDLVNISCQMNETLKWSIKIQGKNSKAVKYYSGNSNSFNIKWYGESDSTKFFTTEECTVTYSLACSNDIVNTLSLTSPAIFNSFPEKYVLVSDFEGNGNVTSWYSYGGTLVSNNSIVQIDSIKSPQGGQFYNITGVSPTKTWFFGGFGNNNNLISSFSKVSLNPDSVYCNLYLSSNRTDGVQPQFTITCTDGVKVTKNITINWTGWKMVSFKLSEIGVLNPRKINGVDIGLGAYPVQSLGGQANIDFIIFSVGEPFLKDYVKP